MFNWKQTIIAAAIIALTATFSAGCAAGHAAAPDGAQWALADRCLSPDDGKARDRHGEGDGSAPAGVARRVTHTPQIWYAADCRRTPAATARIATR